MKDISFEGCCQSWNSC